MSVAESDYTSISMNITFDPESTMATAPINITDDLDVEDTEIFNATLSTTHPHVMFGDDLATITILDNDGKP